MGRILIFLVLLLALASPAAAEGGAEGVELSEGLRARLIDPGQLGVGWGDSDALRLFVEFVPRDEAGGFLSPLQLDARTLDPLRDPPDALPTRPAPSDGLSIQALWGQLPRELGTVQCELVHWSWFHMDGILLYSIDLRTPHGGEVRVRWDALDGGQSQIWDGELPLHESGAEHGAWNVHLPRVRWERPDGSRLYLGLVDVDARARFQDGQLRVSFAPGEVRQPWTLALVMASSEAGFHYRSGQALRLLPDSRKTSNNIDTTMRAMPAICHLCRQATAEATSLRIWPQGDSEIGLELLLTGLTGHGRLDGEAAVLAGFPMARWWIGDQGADRALYVMQRSNPAAERLMEAAGATGRVEAEIRLDTGILLPEPSADLDPDLRQQRQVAHTEKVLPQHLSHELLEAWPNPFREHTSIRVKVPETIGEAFQFENGAPPGVDLMAAPPFGETPSVRIKVYNVSGKLVRILEERPAAQGILQVDWDGTNLSGRPVAAGAYYISVEMGEYKVTRRVLRLRS